MEKMERTTPRHDIVLRDGWSLSRRFRYVGFYELPREDRQRILSGQVYRRLGHALEACWLYPVRKDGRLTPSARRVRLRTSERPHRKVELLSRDQAAACLDQVRGGPWDSWAYSGTRELRLSQDYCVAERLPDLRRQMLGAFGAAESPATALGIAWIPPGAYDKPHFHDVDVIVLALSKRNGTGQLAFKEDGRWRTVPYDAGEAVLIPKYVDHRVHATTIDRFTAALSILE